LNPKLQAYVELVQKFNPKLNLVSRTDLDLFYDRHVSDAIESLRLFMDIYGNPNGYSGYDLGSGNGVPGLVWCILNPSININLVEIDTRKAEFLKHCLRELSVPNCSVLNKSVKDLNMETSQFFVCRAFRNIDKLFEEFPFLLNTKGVLIKGSTWNNELSGLDENLFKAHPYRTLSGTERNIVFYKPKKFCTEL
jgi:16S rRNA (guanine527-N7)-methyltransferase